MVVWDIIETNGISTTFGINELNYDVRVQDDVWVCLLNRDQHSSTYVDVWAGWEISRVERSNQLHIGQCLKIGYKCWVNIPNEIAIFHRDNDQQNHWV